MNGLKFCIQHNIAMRICYRRACHVLALMLLLFLFCVNATPAVAQTIIRVPQNQATIQAAINAASNGDTVLVAPGTYTGNINFSGKAITLASEGGANVTVIAGGTVPSGVIPDSVVTFASGEGVLSRLTGFTVRNNGGTGVRIDSSSPVVKDNIIFDASGCSGGGILIISGSPVIQRNIIYGNGPFRCLGDRGGGGITVGGESSPQILDNVIAGNMSGDEGGGISLTGTKTALIRGNVIAGNKAGECCRQGGGIYTSNWPSSNLGSDYQSDTSIIQNLIVGNSASEGSGIFLRIPPDTQGPLLVNNTVADNDSSQILAYASGSPARLLNNVIVAKPGQTALHCQAPQQIIEFNNIYAPSGVAYGGGCNNVTGTLGNISTDPLFVDPASGNYRVPANSPVVDAATNTASGLPSLDMDGNTRIRDGDSNGIATVDMGAFEFSSISHPLAITSSGADLGTLLSGSAQVSRTVTISNSGPEAVSVVFSAVASNDPTSFAFTTGGPAPCASLSPTLGAGTSCTMVVSFTPSYSGAKNAMLAVMADTVGSPAISRFRANVLQTDTTPDFLLFTTQFGVARGSTLVSNSATVSGIDVPAAISITGGEYSINGSAFTANPGTIQNGQNVVVRLTTSLNYDTPTTATLTVGTVSANFTAITIGPTFSNGNGVSAERPFFLSQNAVPGSTVVSSAVILGGVDVPLAISIAGGEYSIDGSAFTADSGFIQNGQSVVVRVTAPTNFSATTTAQLTIGSRSGVFTVYTPNQVAPSPLTYFPLAGGNRRVMSRNGVAGPMTTVTDAQIFEFDGVVTFGIPDAFDGSIAYFSNDGVIGARLHRILFPPSVIPGCSATVPETDSYAPPMTIIPANVTIGATITSTGTVSANAGVCGTLAFGYTATSLLESIERVSVPAGQFDALKVRLTLSVFGVGVSSSTMWFASGIGEIRTLYEDGTVDALVSTSISRSRPDGFGFAALSSAPINAILVSNPITITGTTAPAAISITGGEYSINGGPFTSAPGSATNGQTVRVRLTSPPQGGASTSASLTVGGITAPFSVTTTAGAPAAPTMVSAKAGITTITVEFSAPASGGNAITGYVATCTSSNGGITASNTGGASATSIQVNGLSNGKRYTCTVAASNELGTGAESQLSNATTPFDITPILQLLLSD